MYRYQYISRSLPTQQLLSGHEPTNRHTFSIIDHFDYSNHIFPILCPLSLNLQEITENLIHT